MVRLRCGLVRRRRGVRQSASDQFCDAGEENIVINDVKEAPTALLAASTFPRQGPLLIEFTEDCVVLGARHPNPDFCVVEVITAPTFQPENSVAPDSLDRDLNGSWC